MRCGGSDWPIADIAGNNDEIRIKALHPAEATPVRMVRMRWYGFREGRMPLAMLNIRKAADMPRSRD
jgi:hypothetical protein